MIFPKNDADFQDYFFEVKKAHNEKLAGYLKESVRIFLTNTHILKNEKAQVFQKCIDYPSSLRVMQTAYFSILLPD